VGEDLPPVNGSLIDETKEGILRQWVRAVKPNVLVD